MVLSRASIPRLVGLALIVSGCRLTGDDGVVGVFSPGAPARIEITTTVVAGGHAMIGIERVDSAQATIKTSTCSQPVVGASCEPADISVVRVLTQSQLDALFGVVTSGEFRAVRASYRRPGNVVPPDFAEVRIDVTVGERTRRITWERDAVIPRVLDDLRCLVAHAAGSLILCAQAP